LLSLAELSWDDLRAVADEPSNPRLVTLLRRANRILERKLRGSWRQTEVSVELDVAREGVLDLFPYDVESDTHSHIEDRSDGFRSFLALLTFTTNHAVGERRLILGIDEAELHLHYDAQADLVRVLTDQTLATQIIYTTHSAGCLPDDLGSGIRAVAPISGDRSKIENGFWSASTDAGSLSALLFAMGASATAFTPARRAVITEGPSDALLLPALLRAASGWPAQRALGFQVAGGIAWTPPANVAVLDLEAARVIYVTDSDDEGAQYREDLEAAGVHPARIFQLAERGDSGVTIEDLLDKATYAAAFTLTLREAFDYSGPDLSPRDLKGEARAVEHAERFAVENGVRKPSKPRVAENVLRLTGASLAYSQWDPSLTPTKPLVRPNKVARVRRLHARIAAALGVDDEYRPTGSEGPSLSSADGG
jgi:hypothetical protein